MNISRLASGRLWDNVDGSIVGVQEIVILLLTPFVLDRMLDVHESMLPRRLKTHRHTFDNKSM